MATSDVDSISAAAVVMLLIDKQFRETPFCGVEHMWWY